MGGDMDRYQQAIQVELEVLKYRARAVSIMLFGIIPDYVLMAQELESGERDYLNTTEKELIARAFEVINTAEKFTHPMAISVISNIAFHVGVIYGAIETENKKELESKINGYKRNATTNVTKRKVIKFWLENSNGCGKDFKEKKDCIEFIKSQHIALESYETIGKWLNRSQIEKYLLTQEIKQREGIL